MSVLFVFLGRLSFGFVDRSMQNLRYLAAVEIGSFAGARRPLGPACIATSLENSRQPFLGALSSFADKVATVLAACYSCARIVIIQRNRPLVAGTCHPSG